MSASPVPADASANTYAPKPYEYAPKEQRSVVDLQVELTAAREELAANIAALKAGIAPANLAREAGQSALRFFRTPDGAVNVKRVAIVGGIVTGFIALRVLTRRR